MGWSSNLVQDLSLGSEKESTLRIAGSNPAHPIKNEERIKFYPGKQKNFIYLVKQKTDSKWKNIAKICGISTWSMRIGYGNERFLVDYATFKKLCLFAKFKEEDFIKDIEKIYSSKWGCIKGGHISGNILKDRTKIKTIKPGLSEKLCEFMGIILGDGHLAPKNYGIFITLNKDEIPYAHYIINLSKELFGISPKLSEHISAENGIRLVIYSKELFLFLKKFKMPHGRKLTSKNTKIPQYAYTNKDFLKGYVRGLFDTEGSLFLSPQDSILDVASNTPLLLKTLKKASSMLGVKFALTPRKAYMHSQKEIKKYFGIIGTSNLKQAIKFIEYIKNKKTLRKKDVPFYFEKYKHLKLPFIFKDALEIMG